LRDEHASSAGFESILDQGTFNATITQERKRAERSGLALVMLLIEVPHTRRQEAQLLFSKIAQALSAIKTDIDILGWLEPDAVMGLLVPDIDPSQVSAMSNRLEIEFQKEITSQFGGQLVPTLSIRPCIFRERLRLKQEDLQFLDALFYPEVCDHPQTKVAFHTVKRLADVLLSVLSLIVLLPLLAAIAVLVKLSSRGPVLFRQVRVGQGMKPFMMCKFRTMYENADHGVHHNYVSWFINSSDRAQHEDEKTFFKLTNDTRITLVGRLLRRTSLDELPQLWNVLTGEMSLVGPRPPLCYELEQYKPWHRRRVLDAKPGLTGLWQVVGRSRTTFDEMVRLDLRYAKTMSFRADMKILLATPRAVITGKGAC
jgi:lipopolysaccharide/colanic/teichoic acid biosynthesis glycosyltransferase